MPRRRLLPLFAAAAALAAFSVTPSLAQTRSKTAHGKSAAKKTTGKKAPAAPASAQGSVPRWMASMTLRDRIAQLVVIPFSGRPMHTRSREYTKFIRLISREHVGGMILVNVSNGRIVAKADPLQTASFINQMQKLAKVPLLVGGDFERGASMRIDATTVFPHAMAFTASGDPAEAKIEGEITAKESRAMGFQWLFFPDADVNNNPDNPIINIRSYGEDPAAVSKFVTGFIDGAHSDPKNRVLVTAKHFPGHGDTATDTHMNLATIPGDLNRLETVEWAPFRAAIADGVDSIMTAHIAVPALDDPGLPATLSPKILTGILRTELGFDGLIVTDALDMGGIGQGFSGGDAAVRALEAGADVLLMPPAPEVAINAVVAAVNSGRLTKKRIDESVLRVLNAKARVGLATKKLVALDQINSVLDSEESNEAAQKIANRAVTVVRNQDGILPLKTAATPTVFYTMIEGPTSVEGLAFTAEVRRHMPKATVIQVDSSMSEADLDAAFARGAGAGQYVIAAYASVAARRGTAALSGSLPKLVLDLTGTKKPVVFVAMGNPYLLRNFPDVAAYVATYSTVPPSEIAAARVVFGDLDVTGKLPVSIPGFAAIGDGLTLPGE